MNFFQLYIKRKPKWISKAFTKLLSIYKSKHTSFKWPKLKHSEVIYFKSNENTELYLQSTDTKLRKKQLIQ